MRRFTAASSFSSAAGWLCREPLSPPAVATCPTTLHKEGVYPDVLLAIGFSPTILF